jgi:hypothetical protein
MTDTTHTPAPDPATAEKPNRNWYVLGLDFGQANDHSALALLEADDIRKPSYRLRGLHRFPLGTPYSELPAALADRIAEPPLARRIGLALDATGVGTPIVELFREQFPRLPIYAITITGGNQVTGTPSNPHVPKHHLINTCSVILERQRLEIAQHMRHTNDLRDELQAYQHETTEHGNEIYAPAHGEHDDLVIALSLALWTAENKQPPIQRNYRPSVPRGRLPTTDEMIRARLRGRYYNW